MGTFSIPMPESSVGHLDSLSCEMREIGIIYAGHGMISTLRNHSGYFSNRDWQKAYMDKEFFLQEPILMSFAQTPGKIVDWCTLKNNPVSSVRQEFLGVDQGVTLCSFHKDYFGFLSLGFLGHRDISEFIEQYGPLLNLYHQQYDDIHLRWRLSSGHP